ncbi:hypothetical protein BDR26DRAFT_666580 [Obelidium mucronatum]|nr:hypothetical protein BDR26DRAFT_666580 [Obelidium mucronatum]
MCLSWSLIWRRTERAVRALQGTTTAEAITATAAVCGLAWTTHRSAMSFNSKPADKRTAQAQSIISPANVLSLTTTWSYEGDIEWDGATTASKLQFKPTRLTRWPCKIVKLLNTIELLVVMHHSDVSPPTHLPIIKVTIAQLRSGHDPRATKWFPAGQFYQEHVEKTVERADGTISTIVLKQPRIRLGTEITNRYSLLMKTDPAAKARALLKPVLRTPDEVKFSMRSEDGNHHHHTKTFTSIMSAQELKSIVSRLDNDPDPLLWTDGVTVEPQEAAAAAGGGGSLIHFDNWNPRCVTSKYPFLERSTPTRPIYVEVKILDLGWSPNAGYAAVSIGIIPQFYPPFMMVGWHGRSIGYHSLNGRKLKSDDVDWSIQGVPYSIGDVVGVGMDLHGSVYFTLNREWMFKSKVGNSGLMFYLGVSCDGPGTVFVDPVAEPDAAWLN